MRKIHKVKPYFESLECSWTTEDRFIFIYLMNKFIKYHLDNWKGGETFKFNFNITKTIRGEKIYANKSQNKKRAKKAQ